MIGAIVDVRSQAELDAAIAAGDVPNLIGDESTTFDVTAASTVRCSGSSSPRVVASGSSSPRVEATGSSSPRVEAYGSSSPRVVATGSSSPRVEASGSSSPRVEASGSSSPRVEASGSSSPRVVAYDSSSPRVEASGDSNVTTQGSVAVEGGPGKRVPVAVPAKPTWETPAEWCEFYGVEVAGGVATLYKAVCDDWRGTHKTLVTYEPGSQPSAPDWDGGIEECGKGLHFSPRPVMALRFCSGATHFLACKVRLSDMSVHPNGSYPAKCKAAKVCAPVVEVDIDGEVIGGVA